MSSDSSHLQGQVEELQARVSQLEKCLRDHGILAESRTSWTSQAERAATVAPSTENGLQIVSPPPPPLPPVYAVPRPPLFSATKASSLQEAASLETRIGSQWFNRLGILAILIGVAWFLKLAFDNHWIGPAGRVLIGLLGGAALIVWSERFRHKGFAVFSYSLKAIGSGTLYLSLWAAFSVYALISAPVAFVAMIAVTGFNGFMAWIQDAELLAVYAIAGGLSTPLLVSTGGNHEITLFTYLLILDLAILILVVLRPWSRLLLMAFTGTVLFVCSWWFVYYSPSQSKPTALFLACFFLLFAFAPRLARFAVDDGTHESPTDNLALAVLPVANAALGFLGFYDVLDVQAGDWAAAWLAVTFAAFYLVLIRLPARGVLRNRPGLTSTLHLAAAVVFLTIAIPLKTQGRWLTIGWLAEGAALAWVASRTRSLLLRVFAGVCLLMGLVALGVIDPTASTTPIFNQRFATHLVAIAALAFVAWIAAHTDDPTEAPSGLQWAEWKGAAVLLINAIALLAIGREIHSFWWTLRWQGGGWQLANEYKMYAQFTYSAFFMLYGAVLLTIGFWKRTAFLRWQALVLLAISIGKVFLLDIGELSRGLRVLSFMGLGALLLAVSFAYQRDWLNLRGAGDETE